MMLLPISPLTLTAEQLSASLPLISKFAQYLAERTYPDFIIGGADDPYINRWWIQKTTDHGCVYLHQVLRDDDDRALHCHPWDNVSVILSGNLREVLPGGVSRILEPGSITYRKAEDAHRLELVDGPVWTLFITGPKVREWGFHCPKGWVHWEVFTSPKDRGLVGRGCE